MKIKHQNVWDIAKEVITRKLIALNPCMRKNKSKTSKLPPCAVLSRFSCVRLCDLWTVARQAPLSMGFSR